MKKKLGIALAIVAAVIVIAIVAFKIQYARMVSYLESYPVETIDLSTVPDGVYSGEFRYFLVDAAVKVTVRNHAIADIKITRQKCGKGYEARDTIERILRKQTPIVDATTGATGSSKGIMFAVYNALRKQRQG